MSRVVIGMDPHKRSATIEVLDENEQPLMADPFGTDSEGYRLLLVAGRRFGQRLWAVEGYYGKPAEVSSRICIPTYANRRHYQSHRQAPTPRQRAQRHRISASGASTAQLVESDVSGCASAPRGPFSARR